MNQKTKNVKIIFFLIILVFVFVNDKYIKVYAQNDIADKNIIIEDGEKVPSVNILKEKSTDIKKETSEVKKQPQDPTKIVEDKRCDKGYGILQKTLNSENLKLQQTNTEIKHLEEVKKTLVEENNALKNIQEQDDNLKNKIKDSENKISDLDKSLKNLYKVRDDLSSPNNSNCVLMDISKVSYDLHSEEIPNSSSYLVVNDDGKIIVASKNENLKIPAHDFVKYFMLGMINRDLISRKITLDYKVHVNSKIYEIQKNQQLDSVGLIVDKKYNLEDLIKLLKYKNYDDVMYALVTNLYGNEKIALTKLNQFLKNTVHLNLTNINSIFGFSNEISNKESEKTQTTAHEILQYKYFIENNKYSFANDISYETPLKSLSKIKSITKNNTMMDKNSRWYYSDVKELYVSSFNKNSLSGLFEITKLNQKYTVIITNAGSQDNLYEQATKLMRNSINYKYSNIVLSRKDDAKINKLFLSLNKNRNLNIKHKTNENEEVNLQLEKTLAFNLPVVYYDYLDFEINYKNNISAPINKNEIIGQLIIKDNKYKKIKTFDNNHTIKINLHVNKNIEKQNIVMIFFKSVQSFFVK